MAHGKNRRCHGCPSRAGRLRELTLSAAAGLALAALALFQAARLVAGEEEPVRRAFTAFQAALKANDPDKTWKLLDGQSQQAAERSARAVRTAYGKAKPETKARLEKALGLPGAELAKLTGVGFLKTKGFRGKYDEVPGSKIAKVVVEGERATVHYVEEDGDKETLRLNRQKGEWKVSAPMPPLPQP